MNDDMVMLFYYWRVEFGIISADKCGIVIPLGDKFEKKSKKSNMSKNLRKFSCFK